MKGKFDYMQLPNHIQFETVSQATKLLEKRRMLYEVHEALEQQKEEFSRQKEGILRHEEIIREADLNIQEHLIKYGQSLIETEKKTQKTKERLRNDRADKAEIDVEIEKESRMIAELRRHRAIFEMKISALGKYRVFLDQINLNKDLFNDTQEMLLRQKILSKSNNSLKQNLQELDGEIEELKNLRTLTKKQKDDEKLRLNNEIAKLQDELDVKWVLAES